MDILIMDLQRTF